MTEPTLDKWITDEQESLWNDLDLAIRDAVNGVWSMSAEDIASRIIGAARIVGPTPTGSVPYSLVSGGVYEAVLLAGGITPPMPDDAEWERLDALMEKHGGGRSVNRPRFAATVEAIRSGAWA